MSIEDFELHYESYKQKYLGYASTHAYVVQSPFFNKLYEQWLAEYRPGLFAQYHLKNIINLVHSPFIGKCYENSLEISDLNGIHDSSKSLRMSSDSQIHYRKTNRRISKFKTEESKKSRGEKHSDIRISIRTR